MTLTAKQSVKIPGQVKNARLEYQVKKSTDPKKALWVVSYEMDDDLEKANPTGRRHSQPFYESQIQEI